MLKRYEMTTHREVERLVFNATVMLGRATLTMLESRVDMKVPQATEDKISHFCCILIFQCLGLHLSMFNGLC